MSLKTNGKLLKVVNLSVFANSNAILTKVNFSLLEHSLTLLIGPNAAGKTSLAGAIMGLDNYTIKEGDIFLDDTNITKLSTSDRAKLGIFLAWQKTPVIDSLKTIDFLQYLDSNNTTKKSLGRDNIIKEGKQFGLNEEILNRPLGVDFSGGELKKLEFLQLLILQPRLAIIDELEAGLDARSLKIFAKIILMLKKKTTFLIISHQVNWQNALHADQILTLKNGTVIKSRV
jgi:Fe-S cluster assembly ATP-binding protein